MDWYTYKLEATNGDTVTCEDCTPLRFKDRPIAASPYRIRNLARFIEHIGHDVKCDMCERVA